MGSSSGRSKIRVLKTTPNLTFKLGRSMKAINIPLLIIFVEFLLTLTARSWPF